MQKCGPKARRCGPVRILDLNGAKARTALSANREEVEMPKKDKQKAATAAAKADKKVNAAGPRKAKAAKAVKAIAKPKKAGKTKKVERPEKPGNLKKDEKSFEPMNMKERAKLLSSEVVYQGPLFRILHDKLIEPGGHPSERDVIRHHGSVVIMAMDSSKSKRNPWIVIERQYRHAANQFLWELPAGKLDPGEDALAGAKRELAHRRNHRVRARSSRRAVGVDRQVIRLVPGSNLIYT